MRPSTARLATDCAKFFARLVGGLGDIGFCRGHLPATLGDGIVFGLIQDL